MGRRSKNFSAFFGNWKFTALFTRTHHESWVGLIHSTASYPIYLLFILLLTYHLRLGFASALLFILFNKTSFSSPPCVLYVPPIFRLIEQMSINVNVSLQLSNTHQQKNMTPTELFRREYPIHVYVWHELLEHTLHPNMKMALQRNKFDHLCSTFMIYCTLKH
jgi:hypothetical protein